MPLTTYPRTHPSHKAPIHVQAGNARDSGPVGGVLTNGREQLVEKCVCLYPPDGQSREAPQFPAPVAKATAHPCTSCSLPALPPRPSPLPRKVTYLDEVLAQKPGPWALPSREPKRRHRIMMITFTFIFKFLIFPHALGVPYKRLRNFLLKP